MPPDTLDFEEPIALLFKEVAALSMLPQTAERQRSLDSLHSRIESIRGEIYRNLTPWQRVLVARIDHRLQHLGLNFTGPDHFFNRVL